MKMFTRRHAIAGLVALTAFGTPGLAAAADTLATIKEKGVMTAGNSASYPPFEFMADGKLTGFDVDLANELGKRMGVRVEFTIVDFKGIVAALVAKRTDILISAITKTPERAQQIAFSEPYYNAGIGAAVLKNSGISKPEDLKGKTVGLQIGSSGERFAKTELKDYIGNAKLYDDFVLAVNDLKNKRVDAVINPLPTLRYNTKNQADITVTETWNQSEVGINTRKEDIELMAEINKHLTAMKADGFLASLDKKWFGAS
ncbi:MAG: glutamine transporter, periplasmic glutamine-binding protein [Xanthobacteraceae bacterium]|jgi:ABC-type amino acid transport substrate-binding protein|nr:glutamine transporter, periplasmic glutamine-binding protein [Xanthobacteraceae bacterium]